MFDAVIKARVAELAVEAIRLKVNLDERQAGSAVAEEKYAQAKRYQECLKVLDEIAEQTDRHHTAKVSIA